MADNQQEVAIKKLREGAPVIITKNNISDMTAEMSGEAADTAMMAVDKYLATQNWEVSKFVMYPCMHLLFHKVLTAGPFVAFNSHRLLANW